MDPKLDIKNIIDKAHASRSLLLNKTLHLSKSSVKEDDLTPEKEPHIRGQLAVIAKQIVANPESILTDCYTDIERKKDWLSLLSKDPFLPDGSIGPIDARSRPGHKIIDHYMTHFHDVKNHKGVSLRSLINQVNVEKALYQNLKMHSTPYCSELRRMLTITNGAGSVTKYRAITTKAIVQKFKAQRVLDPCIGWGGRMLGTLASSPTARYVGCEPDRKTYAANQKILNDKALADANLEKRAQLFFLPAEEALPLYISKLPKFDMVITSPPYFNLEVYTCGDQSINKYTTWLTWTENWLKPVILMCLDQLKPGGTSCWSVKNFTSDKKYPLADVTKKIHEDAGWHLILTVSMTGSGRPGANRIQNNTELRGSEEETFCFQKN